MAQEHTPTPWKVFYAQSANGTILGIGSAATAEGIVDYRGTMWGDEDEAKANAAFIVRAVNERAELIAALENAFVAMGRAGANADTIHPLRGTWEDARAVLARARAE